MAEKTMLIPGADHPITIAPNPNRVVVRVGDQVIADTDRALTLREARYPAVHYIPREDADMSVFVQSDHSTHCPYKGAASYLSIAPLGAGGENAVWTYETPFAAVSEIAGYLAFYPDRVSIVEQVDKW